MSCSGADVITTTASVIGGRMRFASVCVVLSLVVCLGAFPGRVLAQDECTNTPTINDPSVSTVERTCHGTDPAEPAETYKNFTMYSGVSCKYFGYYGRSWQRSTRIFALGDCGSAAANTEPFCPGVVGVAHNGTQTGTFYID